MWVKLLCTATSWRSYTTLQLTRYSLQLLLKQQSVSTSWQRNTTTYGACLHLVIHCVNSQADGQAQLIQLHSNQFTQTLTDSYTSSCQSQSMKHNFTDNFNSRFTIATLHLFHKTISGDNFFFPIRNQQSQITERNSTHEYHTNTTTTVLWPLYRSTCVSRHLQFRTGGFSPTDTGGKGH